jgi:2,3-dihydro-2,3-dihydroxybenzoate dehydrogenase
VNPQGMAGRTALVTGAAGGIGEAVVRELGRLGVTVAAVDRDAESLRARVKELVSIGLRVEAFAADVGSSSGVNELVDGVERRLGPIDYLVNCAGVLRLGEARSLSDEDWAATFSVNANGTFFVSRAVVNKMIGRRHGAVVTVASNAAKTPRTEMSAYAASKAAVAMFTKCLGLEVARYGIRCNVVAPGSTDTQMLRDLWENGAGPESSVAGVPGEFRVGIPLGKLAQPADVASAVAFLLSDNASHITMHDLTVDGGASLGA